MDNDISPIALELLYSPGFFLVREGKKNQPEVTAEASLKAPEITAMQTAEKPGINLEVPVNLVFVVAAPHALQPAELQMLERMAGFIRNELRIGKDWLQGGTELWQELPGNHHWVFFGKQNIDGEPEIFTFVNHPRGPLLMLPAVQTLAPDAALKKQALEALKTWANQA